MAASGKQLSETGGWAAEARATGEQPNAGLIDWLHESGLLTRRLRKHCGSQFAMHVLHDAACQDAKGLHRVVLLCCGDQPCIYAVTDVPASTLATHDWLARLGDEPLGETLQSRADVTRSEFSYALLQPEALPPETGATQATWARRSEFRIGAAALTVTEVFLPALSACAATR